MSDREAIRLNAVREVLEDYRERTESPEEAGERLFGELLARPTRLSSAREPAPEPIPTPERERVCWCGVPGCPNPGGGGFISIGGRPVWGSGFVEVDE